MNFAMIAHKTKFINLVEFALSLLWFICYYQLIADYKSIVVSNNFLNIPVNLIAVLALLSCVFFNFDKTKIWASACLVSINVYFHYISPFTYNVSFSFLNFYLLIKVINYLLFKKTDYLEKSLLTVLIVVSALAYLESGVSKLLNHNWISGIAVIQLLKNSPVANTNILTNFLIQFESFNVFANYSIIFFEIITIFTIFKLRHWIWCHAFYILMHLGIVSSLNLPHISYGMILFHLLILVQIFHTQKLLGKINE